MLDFAFEFFWALVLVGGLLTVSRREPVHSALWLVLTLFGLSVLYLLLSGEFLFAVQIFIYAGGIMVLYLFVIFLVEGSGLRQEEASEPRLHRFLGMIMVAFFSPVVVYLLLGMEIGSLGPAVGPSVGEELAVGAAMSAGAEGAGVLDAHTVGPVDATKNDVNTKVFGLRLFSRYLFPFELISVVLLVAMIGAIGLSRKRFTSYTEEEEARMLSEAHYHGTSVAPPSGEPAGRILAALQEEDQAHHKKPGSDFKVFPDYEE